MSEDSLITNIIGNNSFYYTGFSIQISELKELANEIKVVETEVLEEQLEEVEKRKKYSKSKPLPKELSPMQKRLKSLKTQYLVKKIDACKFKTDFDIDINKYNKVVSIL